MVGAQSATGLRFPWRAMPPPIVGGRWANLQCLVAEGAGNKAPVLCCARCAPVALAVRGGGTGDATTGDSFAFRTPTRSPPPTVAV